MACCALGRASHTAYALGVGAPESVSARVDNSFPRGCGLEVCFSIIDVGVMLVIASVDM